MKKKRMGCQTQCQVKRLKELINNLLNISESIPKGYVEKHNQHIPKVTRMVFMVNSLYMSKDIEVSMLDNFLLL